MNDYIKQNERIDDLQCNGLKIIQKKDGFCFGIDAVLLSNFAQIPHNARVIDLGTGTGIIPILLAAKTKAAEIVGLEIQESFADMAQRSVKMNGIEDRVKILCGDIKDAATMFGKASFDFVVCNPPYMAANAGIINQNDSKAIARHEITCTLNDIIKTASDLLVDYGKMAIIHRPHRIVDLLYIMRCNSIEPKKLRMIYPFHSSNASMVLVESAKLEKSNLTVLPPLYISDNNGEYSKEIRDIYVWTGEE